jgi:hypothetical protein
MLLCKILDRSSMPTIFVLLMFFLKFGGQPVCAHDAAQDFGVSKLNIAIGFFHGDGDTNAPIEGVRRLEEVAKRAGKSKMEFHYFENLDHSLNIIEYFVEGTLPAGHKAIFEFIKKQTAKK